MPMTPSRRAEEIAQEFLELLRMKWMQEPTNFLFPAFQAALHRGISQLLIAYAQEVEARAIETCAEAVCTECRRGHEVVWMETEGAWGHRYAGAMDYCDAGSIWSATGRAQEPGVV